MSSPKRLLLELSLSVNGPYKMYGYGRHLEHAHTKSLKFHEIISPRHSSKNIDPNHLLFYIFLQKITEFFFCKNL